MASQIFHLVLGIKGYKYFSKINEKDFFIGNNFPDIRLITNLKREDTHFLNLNEIKFSELDNSFMSGYKFHLLTDLIQRDYYLNNNGLFLRYGGFDEIKTALILLEDVLFLDKIENIEKYVLLFSEILKDEKEFKIKIEEEKIKQWHNILKKYFLSNNTNIVDNIKTFRSNFSSHDRNDFDKQLEILNILKNDNKIIDFINCFYNEFDEIIEKYI